MSLQVDIGLLWEEPQVRGQFVGAFRVACRTEDSQTGDWESVTGSFEARAAAGSVKSSWGIRLAECITPERAEHIVNRVSAESDTFDLDMVEAGREWESATGRLENRVWWPIVRLQSHDEAEAVLEELRNIAALNPVGLTVMRLDKAVAREPFELRAGDFSATVREVRAVPLNAKAKFRLEDVPVGRGFHWEHKETLDYRGELSLFHPGGDGLTVVNRLPLETYLESAVGSEMRADLPPGFSQAQAICARSTVLATAGRHHRADGFDLCNDDHCQDYYGTRGEAKVVIGPVHATAGQVLVFGDRVVDARYAKSCGGVSERYESVWGMEGPEYLQVRPCGDFAVPDLTRGHQARYFLRKAPAAWCNPEKHPYPDPWHKEPLFRWTMHYNRDQLGELVEQKTGRHVGEVLRIEPLSRGASGRILTLDIVGGEGSVRVYGELNIRRALSKSHLPSSFFEVEVRGDEILLRGGGWGHGVGLCQLGACAMAKAGKSLEEILAHYYPGAGVTTL
jgi:stage II sporulation protein D